MNGGQIHIYVTYVHIYTYAKMHIYIHIYKHVDTTRVDRDDMHTPLIWQMYIYIYIYMKHIM